MSFRMVRPPPRLIDPHPHFAMHLGIDAGPDPHWCPPRETEGESGEVKHPSGPELTASSAPKEPDGCAVETDRTLGQSPGCVKDLVAPAR